MLHNLEEQLERKMRQRKRPAHMAIANRGGGNGCAEEIMELVCESDAFGALLLAEVPGGDGAHAISGAERG
jgi:hypothetical protein